MKFKTHQSSHAQLAAVMNHKSAKAPVTAQLSVHEKQQQMKAWNSRRSFEVKLGRNSWAAGALPLTPLGEHTALLRSPSSIRGPISIDWMKGMWGKGREVEREGERMESDGKWYRTFLWESYAPAEAADWLTDPCSEWMSECTEHDDDVTAMFPQHSPGVVDGRRQRTLTGDVRTSTAITLHSDQPATLQLAHPPRVSAQRRSLHLIISKDAQECKGQTQECAINCIFSDSACYSVN